MRYTTLLVLALCATAQGQDCLEGEIRGTSICTSKGWEEMLTVLGVDDDCLQYDDGELEWASCTTDAITTTDIIWDAGPATSEIFFPQTEWAEAAELEALQERADSLEVAIEKLRWSVVQELRVIHNSIGRHSSESSERIWQAEERIAELERPHWPLVPWWISMAFATFLAIFSFAFYCAQ